MQPKAIAFAICTLFGLPASAQQACGPIDAMQTVLADRWGESAQMTAIGGQGEMVLQIYANTDTGSWTAVVTDTEGHACVTGSGVGFEATPTPPIMGERG